MPLHVEHRYTSTAPYVYTLASDRKVVERKVLLATLVEGWVLILLEEKRGYHLWFARRLLWPTKKPTGFIHYTGEYRGATSLDMDWPAASGRITKTGKVTIADSERRKLDLLDAVALQEMLDELPRHAPFKR